MPGNENATVAITSSEGGEASYEAVTSTIATVEAVVKGEIDETIATEDFVANGPINKPIATELNRQQSKTMHPKAVLLAERVANALYMEAEVNSLPHSAVSIDHGRLAEAMGMSRSFANKTKVYRGIRYAQRLGLISVLSFGRERPVKDLDGRCGLYAVLAIECLDRIPLTDDEIEILKSEVHAHLSRGAWKTRQRVEKYFNEQMTFDALFPHVSAVAVSNRKRPTPGEG